MRSGDTGAGFVSSGGYRGQLETKVGVQMKAVVKPALSMQGVL